MERSFIESVSQLIDRDLTKLAEEITLYPTEESLWQTAPGITNPGGNLCLHLCGNLQHYFGTVLGKTDYVRDRMREFSATGISRAALLDEIERARAAVIQALEHLKPSQLLQPYPENVFGKPMTSMHFFIHLTAHLGYHLGQVNYHRRLVAR